MKERIILAPGINGDELLRSLALNNVNCFNVRIMNAVGLARYGLMKSGVSITEQFVSKQEEIALVSKAVSRSTYFEKATYSDIVDLTNAIRMMRYFVSADDEAGVLSEVLPKGIFREKNNAILAAYNEYIKLLEGVDSIGIIRKAIKECKVLDVDFEVIAEIPLKPIERKLLETLSAGRFSEITIRNMYGAEDKGIRISSYKNCYGAPNEAEDILTDIYSEKSLDKCMIAVTDTRTYSQIFFDQAVNRNLPITFGCGIPIMNSNPAKLLDLYNKWMTTGLFSAASLEALLSSEAFDRKAFIGDFECPETVKMKDLFALLGQLKLSNNLKDNQTKVTAYIETVPAADKNTSIEDQLKLWASELSLPCEEFIHKYAKIRPFGEDYVHVLLNRLDSTALSEICNSLTVVRSSGIDQQAEDVISDLLSSMICYQRSEPGKLHVTDINSAISSVRENIYIAGLSANNYPGTPKENYLLLDEDVRLFGEGMESFTSTERIKAKRDRLFTLAKLAIGLKSDIHVSFAGFNVSELKSQNASSMVFDLFRAENGDSSTVKDLEAKIKKVEYFDPRLDITREIGKAYNEGLGIVKDDKESSTMEAKISTDGKSYSPSALSDFFECKRKYMYKCILKLPDEKEDDPFEVISAIDQGLMAHSLMEELANSSITKDEFLKITSKAFDDYLKSHPALIPSSIAEAKEQFVDMMGSAYDKDPHRKVVLKEEDVECAHEAGITIHGFPDRVEQVGPDEYIIVDFKTGRKVKHVQDDIYSCLQVVIYAYLMEHKGYTVTGGEFRYLRLGQSVSCKYDKNMKKALKVMLLEFMDSVKNNDYPCAETDDKGEPCKYCNYKRLCERVEPEGDD